ncbi:MAG: hypothetical protein HY806_00025 [Nitrospirae bacterium]|nr:hypothetical protein [Nitrospirota bacterium]
MLLKEGCPGSSEIKQPKPEDIKCRHCGKTVEIWTDEVEIKCKHCGKTITRALGPTCLERCAFAKECVGEEKYKRLMKK